MVMAIRRDIEFVDQLEARLKRIEYVVRGHQTRETTQTVGMSATQRLQELERALDHVVSQSQVSQDLLKLSTQFPEIFTRCLEMDTSESATSMKIPVILAAATSYPQTASSLTSVIDMPVPSTALSSRIISAQPELTKLEVVQDLQMKQVNDLKRRSVAVLQRWYSTDIVRAGEYWADVESRVSGIEQKVRHTMALQEQAEANI